MYFDLSSVSNRDLQVLYEYRILKILSVELTEILRAKPTEHLIQTWLPSDKSIDGYETVFETRFEIACGQHVPFLEFIPEDNQDWKWICDFIGIDAEESEVILYSASDRISNLKTIIYQNLTLRQIESLLHDLLENLGILADNIGRLENDISNVFAGNSNIGHRPEGLRNNLLKLAVDDSGTQIVDAGVQIRRAELSRVFVNLSQTQLNGLLPAYTEAVEFRLLEDKRCVVQNINAPRIRFIGKGDLVLRNIRGQVIITQWTGTVTIVDCSEVHLQADSLHQICILDCLRISRNSTVYLENYPHQIESLQVILSSSVRHWSGHVKRLDLVGPGCTYWCSQFVTLPGVLEPGINVNQSAIMDFRLKDIYGTLSREIDKLLIVNQKQIQTRVAQAEPPIQPYECQLKYSAEWMNGVAPGPYSGGGGGVPGEINKVTIEGVPGYLWVPESYSGLGFILALPGYNVGEAEATTYFGAYGAIPIVKPNAVVFIPIRPAKWTLPNNLRTAITRIRADYSLSADNIWFYGFSQGACDFSGCSSWYNWKGTVLVDGNLPSGITVNPALQKVMIIQGAMNYAQAYARVFTNAGLTPVVYDYYSNPNAGHAQVNYWAPSDSNTTYQQIANGNYKQLPSEPPNALLWLCN